MSAGLERAKYLKCVRCGNPLTREDSSVPFFCCDGEEKEHEIFLVSSKFDTEEGKIPMGQGPLVEFPKIK